MIPPANHFFEHSPASLGAWCEQSGMPGFRATQLLEWVYQRGVVDPGAMTNFSKRDREVLRAGMVFTSGRIVRDVTATDGTRKLLVQWEDEYTPTGPGGKAALTGEPTVVSLPVLGAGEALDSRRQTECVMIPTEDRKTACISSQVGCPVGCKFCASGLGGLDHNLSAGRIVEQVWILRKAMQETPSRSADGHTPDFPRITNVVFMGMGEPLSNLGAVVPAIRTICDAACIGISARKVTVSTVGLPKAIEKLAEQLDLPVTLALSLHAPNDELRRQLIPWAQYTTIPELLAACKQWFEKTGREITLEYTLLRGVNDQPTHAHQLAAHAKTLRANINLIRYNEVSGTPFERPRDEDVRVFQEILRSKFVNAHIRASRGRDIGAACGQLRHEAARAVRVG